MFIHIHIHSHSCTLVHSHSKAGTREIEGATKGKFAWNVEIPDGCYCIEYFDPYGKDISAYGGRFEQLLLGLKQVYGCEILQNKTKFQKDGHNCGVICALAAIDRKDAKDFSELCRGWDSAFGRHPKDMSDRINNIRVQINVKAPAWLGEKDFRELFTPVRVLDKHQGNFANTEFLYLGCHASGEFGFVSKRSSDMFATYRHAHNVFFFLNTDNGSGVHWTLVNISRKRHCNCCSLLRVFAM